MPDFEKLKYQRAGAGETLVLVHGYLGGSDMWAAQIEFFKNKYDVVAVDLPGFGKSSNLRSHGSISTIATHILSFLTDIGVEKFHLLGHSMGGMIVQQMTLDAPNRITKLICYGTGPVGVLPGRFEPIATSRQRIKAEGLAKTASCIAATWFADGVEAAGFPLCERLGQMAAVDAALNALTAWENWNVKNRLPEIKCPTLIIWGELDKSYNFSQPKALSEGIPNSQLVIVSNRAHNVHMEAPDEFNRTTAEFLLKIKR